MLITSWPVATMLTAPIAGRLIGKYPDGLLGGIGMAMFACGLWLLAAMPVDVAHWDMVWRMLLAGSGFALYQSPNNHTIVTSAPISRSGAAGGMLSSARMTGQTLGAVVLGTIFVISGGHGGHAEVLALWIAGGFAALAGASRLQSLAEVEAREEDRLPTGIAEFDRALGGGLVAGGVILIGGDPGIGKSTLLLQALTALAETQRKKF